MNTNSLHLIRGLGMAALLALLTSSGNTQAMPGPLRLPAAAGQRLDKTANVHRHGRQNETPLKGLVLQETFCEKADFDGDGTSETQCSTTTHSYDQKGNRISSLAPSVPPALPALPTLYTYDHKGNQLAATFQYLQDSNDDGLPDLNADGLPVISTEVSSVAYDERGNPVEYTYSIGSYYFYSQTFTYDAFNNWLTSGYVVEILGEVQYSGRSVYTNTYDGKGNLSAILELDDYGNDGDVDAQLQWAFTYDPQGHVLTTLVTYSDPSLGQSLITDTYDKKGNRITSASLQDQNGNGLLDLGEYGSIFTNAYDKEGRLVLTQFGDDYDGDGVIDYSGSVQYAY